MLSTFLAEQVVLVVEPKVNYRTSIKQFLSNLKITRIKVVGNVSEARREMLTSKIGLFIVEWSLDEINGLQFCRQLRKEIAYRETPFLLMTVENLRRDIILAAEVDINGYLLKPFSYEDFCTQLQTIVKSLTAPSANTQMMDNADELIEQGELDAAEKIYEEASAQRGPSARGFAGLARICQKRNQMTEAITYLQRAITQNPDYIEAYRMLLDISEERRDRAGIIQAATVLTGLSPDNPRYTLILAKTFLELGQLDGSEKFFRQTLTLSPRLADAYKGLGNVYMAQEDYERAMKSYKKALDLDSDDIATLNSLGMAYVRMGQFKEGIARYMIALKLDPRDARVLFNIGQAYERHGMPAKARYYYGQALANKPGYDKAKRGLERCDKLLAAGGQGKPDQDAFDDDLDMTSEPPPSMTKKSS